MAKKAAKKAAKKVAKKAAKKAAKKKAASKDEFILDVEVLDDDGKPTGDMTKVTANADALRTYADLHDVDVSKAKTVKALAKLVLDSIKPKKGEDSVECVVCNTTVYPNDTFCPFCGADTTEGDTGGLKVFLANKSDEPEEPAEPEESEEPEATGEEDPEPEEASAVDPEGETDDRSLDDRRVNIVTIMTGLRSHMGEAAYDLGQELFRIEQAELYDEGGHDTFRLFCEAEQDKGGLGMTFANARSYMRVFASPNIDREMAGKLGFTRSATMANLLDDPNTAKKAAKLIKPDKDGNIPANTMSTAKLTERAKTIRADVRTSTPPPGTGPRGAPSKPKFRGLLAVRASTKTIAVGDDGVVFPIDEHVAAEVEAVSYDPKTKKVKVKISYCELEN